MWNLFEGGCERKWFEQWWRGGVPEPHLPRGGNCRPAVQAGFRNSNNYGCHDSVAQSPWRWWPQYWLCHWPGCLRVQILFGSESAESCLHNIRSVAMHSEYSGWASIFFVVLNIRTFPAQEWTSKENAIENSLLKRNCSLICHIWNTAIVKSSPRSIDVDVEIVDCHVRLEEWRTLTDTSAISILIFFSVLNYNFWFDFFLILYFEFDCQVRVEDSGKYQCNFNFSFEFFSVLNYNFFSFVSWIFQLWLPGESGGFW